MYTLSQDFDALLARHNEIVDLIHRIAVGHGTDAERGEYRTRIQNAVRPGIYEHFKSSPEKPMRYAVLGVGAVVDTSFVVQVVYSALYLPNVGTLAFRPLVGQENGFLMPIKKGENKDAPEYEGERFRLIESLPLVHVAPKIEAAYLKFFPPEGLRGT